MRPILGLAYASDKLACPGCSGEHPCIECRLYVLGSDKTLERQQAHYVRTGERKSSLCFGEGK